MGLIIFRQKGLGLFKKILPVRRLNTIVRGHYPRFRKRFLTITIYLGLLIYAQLDKSIESIDELILRYWKLVGGSSRRRAVSKQAVSWRNKTLPWQIFQEIFYYLRADHERLTEKKLGLWKGKYLIKSFDASVFDVVARLVKVFGGGGGRGGRLSRRAQLKMQTVYNHLRRAPEFVFITEGREGDSKRAELLLREALRHGFKPGVLLLLVFDLGYFEFRFFEQIKQLGAFFITRMKENTRYTILRQNGPGDYRVRLGISSPDQQSPVELRLVEVEEEGIVYRYLTNLPVEVASPQEIRTIYRKRWEIELFFRDIKHLFKTMRFFSYTENGVKTQLYVALISYVLSRILMEQTAEKHQVKIEYISLKRTVQVIRTWVSGKNQSFWYRRPRRQHLEKLLDEIYYFAYQPRRMKRKVKIIQSQEKEAKNAVA